MQIVSILFFMYDSCGGIPRGSGFLERSSAEGTHAGAIFLIWRKVQFRNVWFSMKKQVRRRRGGTEADYDGDSDQSPKAPEASPVQKGDRLAGPVFTQG